MKSGGASPLLLNAHGPWEEMDPVGRGNSGKESPDGFRKGRLHRRQNMTEKQQLVRSSPWAVFFVLDSLY